MTQKTLYGIFFILFVIYTCDSFVIGAKSRKHPFNIIHKEDVDSQENTVAEFPMSANPGIPIVQPAETVENITNRPAKFSFYRKNKLTSIKHPLPPLLHDIMPHEHLYNSADHDKIHHDFIHHEGPNLQRKLHHHLTLEEIRQRRKKERLQAKLARMQHVTTTSKQPHIDNEVLKSVPSTTEALVDSNVLVTPLTDSNSIQAKEQIKKVEQPESVVKDIVEPPIVGAARHIPEKSSMIETTSAPIKYHAVIPKRRRLPNIATETTTNAPVIEITTNSDTLLKNIFANARRANLNRRITKTTELTTDATTTIPGIKHPSYVRVGLKKHLPKVTEPSVTTVRADMVTLKLLGAENPLPSKRRFHLLTTEAPETTAAGTSEPHKVFEDWRKHLKESIKKRLEKLRQEE